MIQTHAGNARLRHRSGATSETAPVSEGDRPGS